MRASITGGVVLGAVVVKNEALAADAVGADAGNLESPGQHRGCRAPNLPALFPRFSKSSVNTSEGGGDDD